MKNGLIIDKSGNKRYYLNDELHRVDGPADEWANGTKIWFLHGKTHRVGGPAVEYSDGDTYWFLNGKKHRVDGPAVEYPNGSKSWYLNGERHRVDGPAVEYPGGSKYWWLNDKKLFHPKEFKNMEAFFKHLNNNEEYSLQWINDINGMFGFIKNPSGKQTRLNAMRWKI